MPSGVLLFVSKFLLLLYKYLLADYLSSSFLSSPLLFLRSVATQICTRARIDRVAEPFATLVVFERGIVIQILS